MIPDDLRPLLDAVARGDIPVDEALRRLPPGMEAMGFAHVDHDRARRCGFPEVVYAAGKTPEQTVALVRSLVNRCGFAFATRVPDETAEALRASWPEMDFNPRARTCVVGTPPAARPGAETVLVVSAGTSDQPVAEEAAATASVMGCPVETIQDVGVAGLHRLLAHESRLREAGAIVVVAGMEGALPSVVAGLVDAPVIGVPTSVGYGASFGGLAALLGMLTSCASSVSVVNIDNGFGGGCVAARIALRRARGVSAGEAFSLDRSRGES